jgi:hypothetical protein
MSIRAVSMDEWQLAVRRSVEEMAEAVLGRQATSEVKVDLKPSACGAYIPLMSLRDSLRVGVVATPQGCEAIARLMMGTDTTTRLEATDIADAMCEFLNIVAGSVKKQISHKLPALRVGLPIFVSGMVQPTSNVESTEQPLSIGDVPLLVAVMRYRRDGD